MVPHQDCASCCGSHVPGQYSIFPPWYCMVHPVFAEAGMAAGRELCQLPRFPCQKEALDPLPPVTSPLGEPPSLVLLARGSPIGICEAGGRQNPLNHFPRWWYILSVSCPFPRQGPCSRGPAVPESAASGAGEGDGAGKGRPRRSPSPAAVAGTPHLPAGLWHASS